MGNYGMDNEMLTLSHLLLCNVYSFNAMALNWSYLADPGQIDPKKINVYLLERWKSF